MRLKSLLDRDGSKNGARAVVPGRTLYAADEAWSSECLA
jgi:hypothetical protein